MLLDGHISEVNKHVVQLTSAGCVLNCAEPAEAKFVPEDQTKEKASCTYLGCTPVAAIRPTHM